MDDEARGLGNHGRQQGAIGTNCGHQVLVQFLEPLVVVERRESAARRAGTAKHVDKDVDAAELLQHRLGDHTGAFRGREISSNEAHAVVRLRRRRTRRSYDVRSRVTECPHDCGADTFGAAGYQRALIGELQIKAHGVISRNAIFPRSSRKTNRKSTGLPGKLPVSRLVTTYRPSFCSTAKGSLVYEYLAVASVFHALMAAGPQWVCPSSLTIDRVVKQGPMAALSHLSEWKE